jgi:hypothetical protein
MSRLTVQARIRDADGQRIIEVRGQVAKALLALVAAGSRGCTALEVAAWAYRFAAYCHELRRDYGLAIRTDREDHNGGWHGRHVLETPVEILLVDGEPRCGEAA